MNKTPYFHLPLYETGTMADLRDGYNHAMILVDKKLHQLDIQIQAIQNMKKGE